MASEIWKELSRLQGPQWKSDLQFESLLLSDTFPSSHGYENSIWADWVSRVLDGHEAEEKRISQAANDWTPPEGSENWPWEPSDWIADDYWQASQLTGAMYAAMVVSIWSKMEQFLKRVVVRCRRALHLSGSIPYQFDKIKQFFSDSLSLDVAALTDYSVVDAIRILNNSFKHNDDRYEPDPTKPHTVISQTLLHTWSIVDDRREVDFSRLPIKELGVACNGFCSDLLRKLETEIASKFEGSSHGE